MPGKSREGYVIFIIKKVPSYDTHSIIPKVENTKKKGEKQNNLIIISKARVDES